MTVARLALAQTVVTGLASGLGLLGVGPPKRCVKIARSCAGRMAPRSMHSANRHRKRDEYG